MKKKLAVCVSLTVSNVIIRIEGNDVAVDIKAGECVNNVRAKKGICLVDAIRSVPGTEIRPAR